MQPLQLPLGLALRDDSTFDSYYAGRNNQVISHLQQLARGQGEHYLYIWGRIGVGCTHLLHATCNYANELGFSSVYYDLKDPSANISMLQEIENLAVVCLDNIESIAGNQIWEEELFHAFNRMRHNQCSLVISGHTSPKAIDVVLPDLKSRLAWGVAYQVFPLTDVELISALQLRAKQRGLELATDVGEFIIRRAPRMMPHLYELLDKLDAASMVAQRRLTIPFVKATLDI